MDLGAKVIELTLAAILAIEEHRGHGGNAKLVNGTAGIKLTRHFHLCGAARADFKSIRAGQALAVEDRVDRERPLLRLRLDQPEIRELWKLLPLGQGGVDGESPRRNA